MTNSTLVLLYYFFFLTVAGKASAPRFQSYLKSAASTEDAGGVTQAWNECGNQPGPANK